MNQFYKNLALWLVISLMMVILFNIFKTPDRDSTLTSYSDFLSMVEDDSIIQVVIQGDNISGMSTQGMFKTYAPKDPELIKLLRSKGIKITAKPEDDSSWFQMFLSWVPMLLLIGVWIFFMRQMRVGGGKALSFGKSRARLMTDSQEKVLKGCTRTECDTFSGDSTKAIITWKGRSQISHSHSLRLRFFMRKASLYSFKFI